MKRFVVTVLAFCLLPLPPLYGLQWIVDQGLRKSNQELLTEWNDIYDGQINADLLIMGSSRAWVHYSPQILDEELHMNSYNLGIDGWTFPMQWARFKIYLKYDKAPKIVVQNLDYFLLIRRPDLFNASQFLPYLSDPDMRTATKGYKGEFGPLQYYFPMYKYNSNWVMALTGFLNFFGRGKLLRTKIKGYEGQERDWDGSFEKFKQENPNGILQNIDPDVEKEFVDYLRFCHGNGIQVFLVYSPEYIEVQRMTLNRQEIMVRFQQIANETGSVFLDYSNSQISLDRSQFYNSEHLNKTGSENFSRLVARDIHEMLLTN